MYVVATLPWEIQNVIFKNKRVPFRDTVYVLCCYDQTIVYNRRWHRKNGPLAAVHHRRKDDLRLYLCHVFYFLTRFLFYQRFFKVVKVACRYLNSHKKHF